MYAIRSSDSDSPNGLFESRSRLDKESNLTWYERVRAELPDQQGCAILLMGGRDIAHFRLRIAQSVARNDLSPSHWSHVALITRTHRPWKANTLLHEISLAPSRGFGWPPERNALARGRLGDYSDPRVFPNVALISVPCTPGEVENRLSDFARKPLEVDGVSMLVAWLSYLWGAGDQNNPLERSIGIPSAVLVDAVISRVWRDLTPGLASTASCPEAIWQAAKHWSQYHCETDLERDADSTDSALASTLSGFFHTDDRLVPEEKESGRVLYCGR
jgi:hypothetical protein